MPMVDQTLSYVLVLVVASLILLVVGLGFVYLRLVNKYLQLKEEKKAFKQEEQEALEKARLEAQVIISGASQKAEEIIADLNNFKNQHEAGLTKELGKITQSYANVYKEILVNAKDEIYAIVAKETSQIPNDLKVHLMTRLDEFEKSMQQGLVQTQDATKLVFEKLYQKIAEEIKEYKTMRFKQLDDSIYQIIKQVSRKILSKEISVTDHEKLVIKALEEAKRQGVFEQ